MVAGNVPALPAIVPTPMHAQHPLQKHRQKNHVHADERRPEMHFTPKLVHHSASGLRKPVIDTSKQTEDGAWSDDVMKMRDDVIGVVQIQIGRIKCQRNAGEATDAEHREKGGGEKHWYVESNRPAPERDKKCAQN